MERASSLRSKKEGQNSFGNSQLRRYYQEKRMTSEMSPFRNSVSPPALLAQSSGGGTEENNFKNGSSKQGREAGNGSTVPKYVVKQTDKNIQAYIQYQKNTNAILNANSLNQTSENNRLMLHDSGIVINK